MTEPKPDDIEELLRMVRRRELLDLGLDPDSRSGRRWVKTGKLLEQMPCSVYRCYDAAGTLLYVGVTGQGIKRAKRHILEREWWTQMVRQEWEHFGNRERALAREREIIRTENPVHNIMGRPS